MAYIQQDDKLQQDGQAPDVSYPQQQPLSTGGGASADVGSGSGGGASTAGIGAGGTGGWTNVQSYLDANKGGTGSAQALSNQVGTQFDTEKKTMADASQGVLTDSQKQVDDAKIDNTQADQYINQAAGSYQWDGSANDDYNKNVEKMRGSLTNAYAGPTSYSYGFTAPTQQYATGLKDDGAFDGVMNDVYSKSAGKDLTRGQFDLQKQLDVNNEGLSNARQTLLQRYAGLEGDRDNTVKDTTDKLGGLATQYQKNQTGLRDYLGQQQNSFDTQIAKLEADAKAGYNKTYTGENANITDLRQFLQGGLVDDGRNGTVYDAVPQLYTGRDNGQAGFNWQDAQNLLNASTNIRNGGNDEMYIDNSGQFVDAPDVSGYLRGKENNWRNIANPAMQSFYAGQDEKYGQTADTEERKYNSILDFLGQATGKKQQGFKVRG